MADILLELQKLLAASGGLSNLDPDCPLMDLGIDAVDLSNLVAVVEDQFKVALSTMVDENYNLVSLERHLKELTLREFAQCVARLLSD